MNILNAGMSNEEGLKSICRSQCLVFEGGEEWEEEGAEAEWTGEGMC